MAKNPKVQNLLDDLAKIGGFKPERQAEGKCIKCGEVAAPRCTTDAGRREFRISGFCEVCFDEVFANPEGED